MAPAGDLTWFFPHLLDAHRLVEAEVSLNVADFDALPAPTRTLIPLVRFWRRELEAAAQKKAYDKETRKAKSRGGH